MACNGLLGGLVAITAPCAFVTPAAAVLIGVLAGLLVVWTVLELERRFHVDDPVGAVSVHGVCGLWGVLALGLFADGSYGDGWNGVAGPVRGLLYGDPGQFLAEVIGATANIVVVFGLAFGFFMLIEHLMGNRVPLEVEFTGLDALEMGSEAYPELEPRRAKRLWQKPENALCRARGLRIGASNALSFRWENGFSFVIKVKSRKICGRTPSFLLICLKIP